MRFPTSLDNDIKKGNQGGTPRAPFVTFYYDGFGSAAGCRPKMVSAYDYDMYVRGLIGCNRP